MKPTFNKRLLSSWIAASMLYGAAPLALAQDNVEEVIVTGVRASLEKSIDVKRNAASVVDVITAEDIGKLPDTTITDSLQRVTGVQIQRSAGEGSRINVRGSSAVALMLNGEQFLSAGNISGVQPDLTDIPATMVSSLEVLKTTTASVLTGGLTGTVDLKTHRPLKLEEGLTLTGQINGATGSRTKTDDYGIQSFAGYRADGWGAALNVAYSDVTLADDFAGSNGDENALWYGMPDENSGLPSYHDDVNKDGVSSKFLQSEGFAFSSRENQRKRLALNTSFQAELTSALTLTAEAFYTNMDQSRRQNNFVMEGAWSWNWANPTFGELRKAPAGAAYSDFYSVQEYQINAKRVVPNSNERHDDRDSLNTNIELAFDNGEALTGKLRYVHGKATNDSVAFEVDSYMSDGSQFNAYSNLPNGTKQLINPGGYVGTPALDTNGNPAMYYDEKTGQLLPVGNAVVANVKFGKNGLILNLPAGLGSDISQYGLVSNHLSGQKGEATLDAIRFDGTFKADAGILTSVDFGLRAGKREVDYKDWINIALLKNANGTNYGIRWKDADGNAPYLKNDPNKPAEGESSYLNIKFTDPRISKYITRTNDFMGVTGLPAMYFMDTSKLDGRAFTNMLFPNNFDYADPGQSYAVSEESETFYTQFNLAGDIGSMPWSGNLGVRYVRTDLETTSHVVNDKEEGVTTYNYQGVDYLMGSGWDQLDMGTVKTPNSYDDFLPSLNLALDVTEDQKVRFGYNKNVGTLDLGNYGRGLKVWRLFSDGVFKVDRADQNGNPKLPPARVTNVDLSYEWYFAEGSLLSIAAFYRENETALRNTTIYRSDLRDSDGVIRKLNAPVQILESVKGGKSKGFELGYQQALTQLPGLLSHTGFSANYTYSPSESSQKDFYGNNAPEGNNSKQQTNLVVWYDDSKLNARLAYNWRSKRLEWVANHWGTPLAIYQTETEDLSLSLGYNFTDKVTVRFDATNLTKDSPKRYQQWEDQIDKYFFTEARYNLSLQVRY